MKFKNFVDKKEADELNDKIIKASENYAQLMQVDSKDEKQVFKLVINPDAEKTVIFIADGEPAAYGILEFLENKIHIPKSKKVILFPLVYNIEEVKDSGLMVILSEGEKFRCNVDAIKPLAKKYFAIGEDLDSSQNIVIELPKNASLNKKKKFNKDVIKLIIHNF